MHYYEVEDGDNDNYDYNDDLEVDDDDSDSCKDSVFILINRLCKSILLQSNEYANENISKLRAIAYEILLKKKSFCFTKKYKTNLSTHLQVWEENEENDNNCKNNIKSCLSLYDFEPERALDVQLFVARLSCTVASSCGMHGNDVNKIRDTIAKYEELQKTIQTEPYFQTTIGRHILQFLFLLQRNIVDELDLV